MEKGMITVIKEKWDQLLSDEKKIRLILLVGLLGMLLIFLSGTGKEKSSQVPQNAVAVYSVDNESFCRQTEDKILQLIGSIHGVGKAKVWVTLENGTEYVYLQEKTHSTDTSHDMDAQGGSTVREKNDSTASYLLIEQNGIQQPLLQKQIEPTVQGVVVVCEGGATPQVSEQVVNAVSCALGIGSNRVYVALMETP